MSCNATQYTVHCNIACSVRQRKVHFICKILVQYLVHVEVYTGAVLADHPELYRLRQSGHLSLLRSEIGLRLRIGQGFLVLRDYKPVDRVGTSRLYDLISLLSKIGTVLSKQQLLFHTFF